MRLSGIVFICGTFWSTMRVKRALDTMVAAVDAADIQRGLITSNKSRHLFVKAKFVRTALVNVITVWRGLGLRFEQLGATVAAGECSALADLLQLRLDTSDSYPDSLVIDAVGHAKIDV